MKKLLVPFFALLLSASAFGSEMDLTLKKNWTVENSSQKIKPVFTKDADGTLNIETKGASICLSSPAIKFEKGKMYYFEGAIESNSLIYMAIHFYDSAGKEIHSFQFNCIPGTDTELVEAVSGKEIKLKVKDASKWKIGEKIAFGIKTDFSNIPLPVCCLYQRGIKKINKRKDYYEVVLKAPVGKQYAAGTGVMQTHNVGYKLLCNRYKYPVKPIILDFVLKDEMSRSSVENAKWWPSAKTLKLKIVQRGKEKLELKLKDFTISEINADW